jgi:hypothetical protein
MKAVRDSRIFLSAAVEYPGPAASPPEKRRTLDRPQSQSGRFKEEKIPFLLPIFEILSSSP